MILLPLALAAQILGGPDPDTEEGARRFAEGDLPAALGAFSRALEAHPDAPENDLNIAGVHYRMGGESLADALLGYRSAADRSEGTMRRDSFFNLGNALFQAEAFADAATAYGEAIVLDPEDVEARQNLELALRRQQDEQEQEQPQNEQGGDEQDQDEEQEQNQDQHEDREQEPEQDQDQQPSESEPQPWEGPGEVPEFSPEQAERILSALAEIERQFHEDRREANRARAVRRGRH